VGLVVTAADVGVGRAVVTGAFVVGVVVVGCAVVDVVVAATVVDEGRKVVTRRVASRRAGPCDDFVLASAITTTLPTMSAANVSAVRRRACTRACYEPDSIKLT
jgi:hypothetical protein